MTIAVYVLALVLGSVDLIDGSLAFVIAIFSVWAMPIAALFCVVSQVVVLLLNKRRVTHG
jgi:hypothetical protein